VSRPELPQVKRRNECGNDVEERGPSHSPFHPGATRCGAQSSIKIRLQAAGTQSGPCPAVTGNHFRSDGRGVQRMCAARRRRARARSLYRLRAAASASRTAQSCERVLDPVLVVRPAGGSVIAHPAHRCGNDFTWPLGKALIAFRQPPAKRIFIEDCAPHRVAPGWNGLCDGPRSSTSFPHSFLLFTCGSSGLDT
jgi:hypothetical protein